MTDVRSREIAVARYIGYELTRDVIDGYGNEFAFMVSCPGFQTHYSWSEKTAWPHFATDESLLSQLMKGLAGKGWLPELSANIGDRSDKEWEATLNGMNKDYVEYGDSPLEAVFNCAASLPEVQALINESTPS
jgi:hypothetical protein